ncbi:hypothetical protein Tdes44962_MAKER07099 [Teratosphaeria destructans]|uniref:MARVEL domain-containing protein n=1 Tax=Teratosphaeria destructans TaxID=418781 RepID=A0A9W7SZX7_9PEZI|nr:hypothetical protein Tdes44962_MAKER07099 [Teratosphaeria destructans]
MMPTITALKVTHALRIFQATCGALLVALSIVCFTNKSHTPHPDVLQSPAFYAITSGAGAIVAAGLGGASSKCEKVSPWVVLVANLVVAVQMSFAFVMSVWVEACRDHDWTCHLANANAAFEMIGLMTALTLIYLDAMMWRRHRKQVKRMARGVENDAWFGQDGERGGLEQWPGKM